MTRISKTSTTDARRRVPRTDVLLDDPRLRQAADRLGATVVKQVVHSVQGQIRAGSVPVEGAVERCLAGLPAAATSLRRVLNATGVILHTNLGRAPLSRAAVESIAYAAGYVDIEFDLEAGARASRGRGALAALRAQVPSAEDVLVVNNGAAALVLAATELAAGREIVISRGELVEIGDGFRIPDLIVSTGATLREVGTTNRTNLADYRAAVGPQTGFILKVHPSNFYVRGFTSDASVADLATLGVPVVADIGSGLLAPDPSLPDEPDASTWLRGGADLVTASGDKLLGGPQAGLLLGRSDLIAALKRHPLFRALRVDKITLAALEATLVGPPTPTSVALHADPEQMLVRAKQLADAICALGISARAVPSAGVVGGGGAPDRELPGWAVELPAEFGRPLRLGDSSIVARVERDHCLLDLRCVPAADDQQLLSGVEAARNLLRE